MILRPWTDLDRAPFAAINADPEVRRYYYPTVLDRAASDVLIDECRESLETDGFGFLAAERKLDHALLGGIGLSVVGQGVPSIASSVEIGWILGKPTGARATA